MQTEISRKYEASAQRVRHALGVLAELLEKYDPNQPRVPAGNSEGGRWTDGGSGSGSNGDRSSRPHINDFLPDVTHPDYREPELGHPPVVEIFSGLTTFGARAAVRVAAGLASAVGASNRISRAVKLIEEYLGGIGQVKLNRAGDIYVMRGNKKVRFDINNPGRQKKPHFQIEELVKEGGKRKWKDAGPEHRYFFREKDSP
jgi:hypothetical protein